ncbi:MAG: lipocalin family protein [Gammaproteobacteria bacterium]
MIALRLLPAVLAAALLGAGCSHTHAPLPTVAAVDLDRYAGRWVEIAHLPNRFQAQCVSDTRATYTRDKDRITVLNACRTADGGFDSVQGIAHAVEGSGNAKLRVSFFRPFYGDYWVLALDPDYRWVLVGEPSRQYAWILARTPQLDAATRDALLARAAELGFDRSAFVTTPHTQP